MTHDGSHRPRVDVALATYNGARFLAEQLRSIRAQGWGNIRVVLSDDGSTDCTVAVAQEACDGLMIDILPDRSRKGVRRNFSNALEATSADYVALCDQDDVWRNDKIELLMAEMIALEERRSAQTPLLVFSDLEIVDDKLATVSRSFFEATVKSPQVRRFRDVAIGNHVPGCAYLVNRALLRIALPIPSVDIHDHWLFQVAVLVGQVGYVDAPLVKYRQHGGNTIGLNRAGSPAARLHAMARRWIARPRAWADRAHGIRSNMKTLEQWLATIDGAPTVTAEDRGLIRMLGAPVRPHALRRALRGAELGERAIDARGIIWQLRR